MRRVSEISFQNPFEAGNQLNAGVLSQSASSNHALLITKSALVISICNRMGPRAIKVDFQSVLRTLESLFWFLV